MIRIPLPPATAAWLAAVVAGLGSGCMHPLGSATLLFDRDGPRAMLGGWVDSGDLPRGTDLQVGQLVIHADFPLGGHHRLVRELDALRGDVSQTLGTPISDEPVHLYLFESPERFSAFVGRRFPAFPTRRAFFVETDTTLAVFAAWQDRIAEDLRHETTHGYVHAVVPAVPLWLDEGIAEFFELPRSDAGLHRQHVAHLVGRLVEGTWQPDLDRLEQITDATLLSQDEYAEAWCWVHWMLCTTPERREMLQDFLTDLRRHGTTAPLSARLRHATGSRGSPASDVRRHLEELGRTTGDL